MLGTLVPVAEWTLSRVSATGKGEGQIAPHALDALCLVVEQLCDPTFGRTPAIHVVADGEVPGTPVGPSRGDDPSGGRTGDHPALRTIAREMGREMVARAAAEIPGCPEAILAACGYVVGSGQSPHAPAELRGYSPRAMVTSPAWGALAAMSGGGALSGVIPVGWAPVVLALAITHAPSMSGTDLSLVLDVAADVVGPVLSDPAMVRACVRTLRLLSDPPGETTARDQAWEAASEAEESEEAAGRVLWALARTANGILIDTAQRSTAVVISALRASLSPALFSPPLLRHHLEGGPFPWLIDRAISVALRSPRVARLLSAHLTAVFAARPVSALPHFGRLRSLLLLRSDLPDGFGATDAATFPPPRGGAVSQGAAVAAGEGGAVCGEPFGINEWVEAGNTLLWSGTEHAPRAAVLALLERWCQMAVSGGEAVGCGDAVKTPAPRGEGAEAALAARLFLGMLLEDSLSDAMLADSRCVKVGVPRDAAGSPPFDLRICATHSVSVINSCVPFAGAMEMADGTLRVDLHASGPARTDCPRARSCRQHSISHRLQVRLFQGVGVLSNVVAEPAAVAASASPADFDMKVATDALRAVARDATAQISESLGEERHEKSTALRQNGPKVQ